MKMHLFLDIAVPTETSGSIFSFHVMLVGVYSF